ncbi:DNA-methyltransferase [Vagococcus fluvialis]|uniref:DNA-methyltransferase n=1 Tax=Vagococcus fluvialis TaxID=2738 RepID=UPI003D135A31
MVNEILVGDALEKLKEIPDRTVQTVITSPPYYGLRDYGVEGQIGLEETPEEYIDRLVEVFREVRRTLKDDGTLWLNLGDSYWSKRSKNGLSWTQEGSKNIKQSLRAGGKNHKFYKPKDLMGMPWRVALALQQDGWYLRSDIIWNKPNVIPESVKDRPTKSHEYIFLLSKSEKYYYDHEAIKEDSVYKEKGYEPVRGSNGTFGPLQSRIRESKEKGSFKGKNGNESFRAVRNKRNKRDVWTIPTSSFKGAHFATFPEKLVEPCVLAGSKEKDIVLDPFGGSGTTAAVALKNNRNYLIIELNTDYSELIKERLKKY